MKEQLQIQKEILSIFKECTQIGDKQPWKNPQYVLGASRFNDYMFDRKKLLNNAENIYYLLTYIMSYNEQVSFGELKKDRDGKLWTQMDAQVDYLVAMGNALGYIKSEEHLNDNKSEYVISRT